MNKAIIEKEAKQIVSRAFSEMHDEERRDYLKDYTDSRWNPGKSKIPPRRKKRQVLRRERKREKQRKKFLGLF